MILFICVFSLHKAPLYSTQKLGQENFFTHDEGEMNEMNKWKTFKTRTAAAMKTWRTLKYFGLFFSTKTDKNSTKPFQKIASELFVSHTYIHLMKFHLKLFPRSCWSSCCSLDEICRAFFRGIRDVVEECFSAKTSINFSLLYLWCCCCCWWWWRIRKTGKENYFYVPLNVF